MSGAKVTGRLFAGMTTVAHTLISFFSLECHGAIVPTLSSNKTGRKEKNNHVSSSEGSPSEVLSLCEFALMLFGL